jgi:hypothetical protein
MWNQVIFFFLNGVGTLIIETAWLKKRTAAFYSYIFWGSVQGAGTLENGRAGPSPEERSMPTLRQRSFFP